MDPELKRTLEEIHALAKDNHRMLRAIRRAQWFGFFGKIIIWVIVLILPLYIYQQYLGPLISAFSANSGTATSSSNIFGFPSTTEAQKLLNSFNAGR